MLQNHAVKARRIAATITNVDSRCAARTHIPPLHRVGSSFIHSASASPSARVLCRTLSYQSWRGLSSVPYLHQSISRLSSREQNGAALPATPQRSCNAEPKERSIRASLDEDVFERPCPSHTFQQAQAALTRAAKLLDTLGLNEACTLMHKMIGVLLINMAALHLLEPLSRAMFNLVRRIFTHAEELEDRNEANAWRHEAFDLIDNLAMRLVYFADERSSTTAVKLVRYLLECGWTVGSPSTSKRSRNETEVARERFLGLLEILCGLSQQEQVPIRSSASKVLFQPLETYDPLFLTSPTCADLLTLLQATPCQGYWLLHVAVELSIANGNRTTADARTKTLGSLTESLQRVHQGSALSGKLVDRVISARLDHILSYPGISERARRRKALEDLKKQTQTWPHLSWHTVRDTVLRHFTPLSICPPRHFLERLQLAERQEQDMSEETGVKADVSDLTEMRLGPSSWSSVDHLQRFLSGLQCRKRVDRHVVSAGVEAWTAVISNTETAAVPTQSMAKAVCLSVTGDYWDDALELLEKWHGAGHQPKLSSQAKLHAVDRLRACLSQHGVPMGSFNLSSEVCWAIPEKLPLPPISRRMPRSLLISALRADRPDACFAVWQHGAEACGFPHDGVSLSGLLNAAMHATRQENVVHQLLSHEQTVSEHLMYLFQRYNFHDVTLWDGTAPLLKARDIFREVLFSSHPEVKGLRTAIDAFHHQLSRRDLKWPLRQVNIWDRWMMQVWQSFTSRYEAARSVKGDGQSAIDSSTGPGKSPWTSVTFSPELFENYLQLLYVLRQVTHRQGQPEAHLVWEEPMEVLSWMRELNIQPTKNSLAVVALCLFESTPLWLSDGFDDDATSGTASEAATMGALQHWCSEWMDPNIYPSWTEVSKLRSATANLYTEKYSSAVRASRDFRAKS